MPELSHDFPGINTMARVGRVSRLRDLCPVAAHSDGDVAQPFCTLQATIPERRFEKLNSMYEDEFIQTLWILWQTRPETPLGAQAMTA